MVSQFLKVNMIQFIKPTPNLISILLGALMMISCSTQPSLNMDVKKELAPTGKLRAGMNLGNNLFTQKNNLGELQGVSVDLMQELAQRLGVPLDLVIYDEPGQVAEASAKGVWDVAILAIEQTRAKTLSFSPAMTEIEGGYVVHQKSSLTRIDQIDAIGIKIAAPEKAGYELFLTNTLKNASIVRTKNFANSIEMFNLNQVDVLAGLKPNLIDSMNKIPEGKLLDGHFMVINHGFAIPRGHIAGEEYLRNFVKELNASSFVARSIEKHQIKGLKAIKE
jgi:polar amino acid transport system substrate-binding protein